MNNHPVRLQRDTANRMILGVCAGLARRYGTDPFWVRLGAVALLFLGVGLIIPVYLLAALLMGEAR